MLLPISVKAALLIEEMIRNHISMLELDGEFNPHEENYFADEIEELQAVLDNLGNLTC